MVSLILVSHSEPLAQGVYELVQQMVNGKVAIAIAAGSGNPDQPIGTDPMRVLAAMQTVYSDDGVLVLMDLGSAIMSAEAAIEFLEAEQQEKIYLCEAPLVEGAMAAATAALGGHSIEAVFQEARQSLAYKQEQLTPLLRIAPVPVQGEAKQANLTLTNLATTSDSSRSTLRFANLLGLHARPAARFAEIVSRFKVHVIVTHKDKQAAGDSLNQLLLLNARQGDEIQVQASGVDAPALLAALEELAANNWGDVDQKASEGGEKAETRPSSLAHLSSPLAPRPSPLAPRPPFPYPPSLQAVAASPGVAFGPAVLHRPAHLTLVERPSEDSASEWQRIQRSIEQAAKQLEQLRTFTAQRAGTQEAAIFDAHLQLLRDSQLLHEVRRLIEGQKLNAETAWRSAIQELVSQYQTIKDDILAQRAADILDVGSRVLRHLIQEESSIPTFSQPGILVSQELLPSDVGSLNREMVQGIMTVVGGTSGHSAILARSLGIPAVVGIEDALTRIQPGQLVAIDGNSGAVWLDPSPELLAEMSQQRAEKQGRVAVQLRSARQPATTQDGVTLEVAANIGSPSEVTKAIEQGAEGIGLFRTEFLFMDRPTPPNESEQVRAYTSAVLACGKHPLIIRTIDVGGDKAIPSLGIAQEANPFLGRRGIRYALAFPELFKTQLRAILRASDHGVIRLMFPMVTTLDEIRAAKQHLAEVQQELRAAKVPFDASMQVGIMIETPAAVASAAQLAPHVNFFSIGANDLTQYMMAADRGNANVANLVTPWQPAVLWAIHHTIQTGRAAGIWVGMCGEMAGDPLATAFLVGSGIRELSMNPPAIPAIKAQIRALRMEEAKRVAEHVLTLQSADEVKRYLEGVKG